jgi:hypothetical protein
MIMERLKHITIVFFLVAAVLPTTAVLAKEASVLLQEGLYAEEVDGDLDAAIKIYEKVIQDSSAQRSHVAQALYRQGMCYLKKQREQQAKLVLEKLITEYGDQTKVVNQAKPLLQDLGNADPAALMPPDTLVYLEFGSPGKQVETILDMLKGTPIENPLAAIGDQYEGGASPGNIVAGFLNPNMMAEFKKIRGAGIGITGICQENPPVIVVLFPGKSDALKGLIAGGLALVAKPVEAIEGMQTVEFTDGGGAAYDDTVVILASPPAYQEGQLTWCVKQYKGVSKAPTLASSNKSFAKVKKNDRQENAFTLWANVDQVYTALTKEFPEGQIPQEILHANGLADFEHIDDLITYLSLKEDGIALEANVSFKEGHNSMAYNLFRTPKLSKAALDAIPPDAIGLFSIALNGANSPQSYAIREQIRKASGFDLGGDLFANIEQITLFAIPSAGALPASLAGAPPFVGSIGLALRSPNPGQTRKVLTGAFKAANLMSGQSASEEPEQQFGRYQIDLINNQTIHCYTDQNSKTTILSLNPNVVEASARDRARSVAGAPLKKALDELSPGVSKLALFNVGGAIQAGGASFLSGMNESNEDITELFAQVAKSCEKTTVQLRTHEENNNFNIRVEMRDLPPAGELFGPMMQLSQMVSEAREKVWAEKKEAGIPASVKKASRPVVIDGKAEDLWSEACQYKIGNVIYSPISSDEDFSASYKAMWDADNLYVMVNVMDDVLKNDSGEFWLDDAVEVFIDADNSKSGGYGSNDYQFYFEWDAADPRMGETQHGRTDGVEFAVGRTDGGYRVEIMFPWSTLGTSPAAGARIGLDVHANDDDDGGDRDTKLTWRGKEDNAWQNPSVLGTAELAGLIGWWKFDGNAKDSSANANHGAEKGNPSYAAGKLDRAIRFDGDGDRIEVPVTVADNPELYPTQAASASAWVRTTASARELHSLIRHEFHFTPLQTFGGSARVATFVNRNGSRELHLTSFDWSKVNDGNWHHYVATYNNGICEAWIDGAKEVSDNIGAFSLWTRDNQPWVFGGKERGEGGGEHYPGDLDDVRIYNYALSDDEIGALYNEGK